MSGLDAFRAVVTEAWEGLGYRVIDDLDLERGDGEHRTVFFPVAERAEVANTDGFGLRWYIKAEAYFQRAPEASRTYASGRIEAERGALQLIEAFNARGYLGPGVAGAYVAGVSFRDLENFDRPALAGGLPDAQVFVATMEFVVETYEGVSV